jgi:hypothetical protein
MIFTRIGACPDPIGRKVLVWSRADVVKNAFKESFYV